LKAFAVSESPKPPTHIQFETELKIAISPDTMREVETRIRHKNLKFVKEVLLEDTYPKPRNLQ
jgi:adenylate cyclase class IV